MKFNWENPRISIGQWDFWTGGQFLANCLSFSKCMMPIMPAQNIYNLLPIVDKDAAYYQKKFDMLSQLKPVGSKSDNKDWHNPHGFNNSDNWLDVNPWGLNDIDFAVSNGTKFNGLLWKDAKFASRDYFDRFWRKPAIATSNSTHGIFIKTHHQDQTAGLKYLLPNAKIFSVQGFTKWQSYCKDIKNGAANNFSSSAELEIYFSIAYKPPEDAFVFEVDDLIRSETSFFEQMNLAYSYFEYQDFNHVSKYLTDYRNLYIRWNIEFNK
jgi:L-rhamnose mutarotase